MSTQYQKLANSLSREGHHPLHTFRQWTEAMESTLFLRGEIAKALEALGGYGLRLEPNGDLIHFELGLYQSKRIVQFYTTMGRDLAPTISAVFLHGTDLAPVEITPSRVSTPEFQATIELTVMSALCFLFEIDLPPAFKVADILDSVGRPAFNAVAVASGGGPEMGSAAGGCL